jgi:undecaprenyl diphosphate synthase
MSLDVEILTVYAFSTENWRRDPKEVSVLMNLFATYAGRFQQEALSRNIRVKVLATGISF